MNKLERMDSVLVDCRLKLDELNDYGWCQIANPAVREIVESCLERENVTYECDYLQPATIKVVGGIK